jgi:hypothetical protein
MRVYVRAPVTIQKIEAGTRRPSRQLAELLRTRLAALRGGARTREHGSQVLPQAIDHDIHPQTKVVKVSYHTERPPA